MNITELLNYGRKKIQEKNIEDSNIIAKLLIKSILNLTDNELIINGDKLVAVEDINKFEDLINKIVEGIPVQYLINNQEFYGLDFYVNENVLIPQPDTEILVEEVINICKDKKNDSKIDILDICTGSGAIGISVANNVKNAKLVLSDISEKALEIAKKNSIKNNVVDNILFVKSNMFENIDNKFNIIVSNPPYIESDIINKLDKQVQNEPHLALDGGKDGLDFYKILVKESKKYLNTNGYLCMEIGYNQKDKVEELLKNEGYKNICCKKDLSGNDRVIIANI